MEIEERKNYSGINNHGLKFKVIKYIHINSVMIEFEIDKLQKTYSWDVIIKGKCKHPNTKKGLTVSYSIAYDVWSSLKRRTINTNKNNFLDNKHTYENVILCDEWLLFENFEKWFNINYIENYHLDKDLFCMNKNKIYSPKTCCFLPLILNNQFKKYLKPTQTGFQNIFPSKNNFKVIINNKTIGSYKNIPDAQKAYITAKLNYIKNLTEEFKDKLKQNVYDKLKSITFEDLFLFTYNQNIKIKNGKENK